MEVGDTFHPRDIYIDKTRAERVEETATGIKHFCDSYETYFCLTFSHAH